MTYICYQNKNFTEARLTMVEQANAILDEYSDDGYTLTLRQLYYQFVARDLIPNNIRSYKNLGNLVSDGRLAGLISWTSIEDRGRETHIPFVQESIKGALEGIQYAYALDFWKEQPCYVEVWIEKDALVNVIERPANRWKVPFLACRGYISSSEAWRAGQRFQEASDNGKDCIILHLGDHDPSGIDMTRDNHDRMELFGTYVEVRRLALDQIERYNPPPNPAKMTDTRAGDYIAQFGSTSWELDALPPNVIADLVDREIRSLIRTSEWNDVSTEQRKNRAGLAWLSSNAQAAVDWATEQAKEEGSFDDYDDDE